MKMVDHAIWYGSLGYPVFPCVKGGKAPLTTHGYKDASTEEEAIREMWEREPLANIGLSAKGLLVIDVDKEDNPWPSDPDKAESLAAAPIALTPNSGRHYVFRRPEGKEWKCTTSKIADSVDIRTDGGHIVVAPSTFGGKEYRWAEYCELNVPPNELPLPPSWLAEEMDNITEPASSPAMLEQGNAIPEGYRNSTLASLAGVARRHGASEREIDAFLQQVNNDRCVPELPPQEVSRIARSIASYEPNQMATALVEDHYAQDFQANERTTVKELERLSDSQLRVPGLVSEVMDHCLSTAPYPNHVLAFGGAISLLSCLSGRKVRDRGDNRTNLYVLGLAHSASGKDWPRKLNGRILYEIGAANRLGEKFASGPGIEDALESQPCMLFQTDEFDTLLQSINKAKGELQEGILSTLLTLYSSANAVFPMRRKAGKDQTFIYQPSMTIFGTAIPNHYYAALSERMLTNGLFARMLVLDAGRRASGQEPRTMKVPERILETAKYWVEYGLSLGNLCHVNPEPAFVEHDDEAKKLVTDIRVEADQRYAQAEDKNDAVGTTVWGRASEHMRKLSLLYAISENYKSPMIRKEAVEWAWTLATNQVERMLFMAKSSVADNPFHAHCLKLKKKLRESPEHTLGHSDLLKWMKLRAQVFDNVIDTLVQQGDVAPLKKEAQRGRPGMLYKLIERVN